jgi:hypothetical protein
MTEDNGLVARAELARQLNGAIYEVGRSFSDGDEEDFSVTFYCECGCMAEIKLLLREYDVGAGASIEGHSRRHES